MCVAYVDIYISSQKLYFQNETTSCSHNMSSTPLHSTPHSRTPSTHTQKRCATLTPAQTKQSILQLFLPSLQAHPLSSPLTSLSSAGFHPIVPSINISPMHLRIPSPPPSPPYSLIPLSLLSPPLPTPKHHSTHVTVQGSGMQQHSYPSHSMHFVRPACWLVPGGRGLPVW